MNDFYSLLSKKDIDLDELVEIISDKKLKSIVRKSDFTQEANETNIVDNLIRLHDEKLGAYFHLKVTVESMMNSNSNNYMYCMAYLLAGVLVLNFDTNLAMIIGILASALLLFRVLRDEYNSMRLEFISTMIKIADKKIYVK